MQDTLDMELMLHTTGWSGQKVDVPPSNGEQLQATECTTATGNYQYTTSIRVSTIAKKYILVLHQLLLIFFLSKQTMTQHV